MYQFSKDVNTISTNRKLGFLQNTFLYKYNKLILFNEN